MAVSQNTKIWLSYDLGINGDYEGLYTWLDKHSAKECGDSFAIINEFEYTGDLVKTVIQELKQNVTLRKRDRFYLICTKPVVAKFVIGGRKRSPWFGYSISSLDETDA